MKSNLDAAKRMARILGITVSRCKEMLKAGNQAGLHTSVQAYTKRKTRRKAWREQLQDYSGASSMVRSGSRARKGN